VGTVFIRRLPVDCVIGVHPYERVSRQRLLVSVSLETDFSKAAATDALGDTVDYTAIAAHIRTSAQDGQYRLIETLAEKLLSDLLKAPVTEVVVEIEKPAALPDTREVGVRAQRRRDPEP
jgi:dihydroneopterin aldolase